MRRAKKGRRTHGVEVAGLTGLWTQRRSEFVRLSSGNLACVKEAGVYLVGVDAMPDSRLAVR